MISGGLFKKMTDNEITELRLEFLNSGIVILDDLINQSTFQKINNEVSKMLLFSKRKDIEVKSEVVSRRNMSTVGGRIIKSKSDFLKTLYFSKDLNMLLSLIANENVYCVKDENEDVVINMMHKESDAHGKHKDTYAYAFNIMVSAPPLDGGGDLLMRHSDENSIGRYNIKAGQCYLMRTDLYEHEVTKLKCDSQRVALNMSYANENTKDLFSYSSDLLYS